MTARVALLSTDPSGEASTSCRVNRGFASAATLTRRSRFSFSTDDAGRIVKPEPLTANSFRTE